MKKNYENLSEKEIQLKQLEMLILIHGKMRDENKPALPDIGIINDREFCAMMRFSRATARKLRDSGEIRYTTMGKLIYYKLSDVIEMMNERFDRT
jgi:predicted MarR family transcription regulator